MSFRPHTSRAFAAAYSIRAAAVIAALALTPAAQAQNATWTGAATPDPNWMTNGNWLSNTPPGGGGTVTFDSNSTQNLATVNDFNGLSLNGIVVGAVPSSSLVSIGGNSFTLGAGGIDLSPGGASSLNQALTIALGTNQTITLGASQNWKFFTQSTAGSAQTLTIGSPIVGAVGANLTYGVTNNGTGAASSGTINLQVANTYAGNTTVGGPNTTYVLGSNSPFGIGGTVTQNSFNTAPRYQTSGAAAINNTMEWGSGFMYTLASSGSLTFGGPITFFGTNGGQVNRTVNNASNQTITFNGDITMSKPGESVAKVFILQPGTATGDVIVNGLILDGDSASGLLTKSGIGTAYINSTANTFRGQVAIQNGILEIKSLADQGTNSSLGTGATSPSIQIGNGANSATLRYTGTANVSTNRAISPLGSTGGATIENAGVGTMTFTADFLAGGNGNHTVTLSGTNTGANTIGGIIRDPNATTKVALTKAGPGTWVLTAANTYSGATTVSDGTLRVNGSLVGNPGPTPAPGTGAVTANTGSTLGGTGTIKPGGTNLVAIQSGAVLAPGPGGNTTTGTLTIDSSLTTAASVLSLASGASIFEKVNNATLADQVALINGAAGDIAFNNNPINFSDLSSGSLAPGVAYTLFTADVANAYSGLVTDGSGNITSGLTIGTGLSAYTGPRAPSLQQVGNNIVLNIGLRGDYNGNGTLDTADYVVWRDGLGTTYTQDDYDVWRAHFGQTAGSGSGASANAAVPEPTTLLLMILAAAGWCLRPRRAA